MAGPRDPQAANLLQAPLAYPGLDEQEDVILATGVAEARRPKPKTRGTGGAKPATPVQPKPARTLTEEQQVTADQLQTIVVQTPAGDRASYGSAAAVVLRVEWKDSAGNLVPWDPNKIHMRFGDPRKGGVKKDGAGVLTFHPTFTPQSVVLEVDLWSQKQGGWKAHRVYVQTITAYCAIDVGQLSAEEQHVVATLFSEGGSNATGFEKEELIRVMWCIEHRRALLAEIDEALKQNPKDATALARKDFAVARGWGKRGTYESVLNKAQFSGVGSREYNKAKDPANEIKSETECTRLKMTLDVALGVMDGTIADPDAGRGNSKAPGCFYYMTKAKWEENTKWNLANPNKPQKFAPTWQKLPSKSTEVHYYWGIEPEGAFK